MDLERVDVAVKVAAVALMGIAAVALLAVGLMTTLFGLGWAKLVGLAVLAAGVGLWAVTFWLIADRPRSWASPEDPPSYRRRR